MALRRNAGEVHWAVRPMVVIEGISMINGAGSEREHAV